MKNANRLLKSADTVEIPQAESESKRKSRLGSFGIKRWLVKHSRKIMLITLLPLGAVFLLGISKHYQNEKVCKQIKINIETQSKDLFLDANGIRKMLGVEEKYLGQPIYTVELNELEQFLIQNSYVDSAEAYFQSDGVLNINISLRKPIARILNNDGRSFYIDQKMRPMPISNHYTARTVLVRGDFKDWDSTGLTNWYNSPLIQDLLPMINYIHQDSFWNAQLSEIVIDEHKELIVYPTIGKLKIEFGTPHYYEQKFNHLFQFYSQILNRVGWDYYSKISLRFRNQLVAEKKTMNIEHKNHDKKNAEPKPKR